VNFNNLVNLIILERKNRDTNRVSKIITSYNNKILMLQKRDGKFELPGGHIEVGEDAISGAKREFFEETGLDIKRLKQITSNSERVLYRGTILNSNIKLSNEHKSFKFVSEKNLFKLPLSKWSKKDLAFLKQKEKQPIEEKKIHEPVKPGILKKRLGKLSCSKVKAKKSSLKNKGTHFAKALQRYLNYHCNK
tara:strand:- start:5693 stop:6268 length:576 start_codon:yes stop_codon:yes gene_type:complete